MYAVIMAGGSGTRLWPLSREANPKQLHALVSDRSMIQETVDRLRPIVGPDRTWVLTGRRYVDRIRAHLPDLPADQIVAEPFPLGTSLAIGLAMLHVAQADPKGIAVVAWSDSYIGRSDAFLRALESAEAAARLADGVIIGVEPTFPATGYGYIRAGTPVEGGPRDAFWIDRFVEKPGLEQAEQFLAEGSYLWNPGIAVWRVDKFLALFQRLLPEEYDALKRVEPHLGTDEEACAIERELRDLPKLAIDYTIYEKAEGMAVVAADLDWSDVGTWDALKEILPPNEGSNVIRGRKVVAIDSDGCLVYGDGRLITLLGVHDLVVVDAGDALLIAHRSKGQQVKDVVERLRSQGEEDYL